MFTERLQVLLSRTQRRRLELESRRRRVSVGSLIREAVDARAQKTPLDERRKAVAEIKLMSAGRFIAPETLERIIDEEREEPLRQIRRRPRR